MSRRYVEPARALHRDDVDSVETFMEMRKRLVYTGVMLRLCMEP